MAGFSVKKPLTVFVAVLGIIVLGVVAYLKMTPDLLPNMDFPYVIIVTSDPGASPESVEQTITKPMEQSMSTLDKIKDVTSTSQNSVSMVVLEFENGANMDSLGIDIQQQISALEGQWSDTVSSPYILKVNPSMIPVMVAAISSDTMDVGELSDFVDEDLTAKLTGITGVASVDIAGTVDREMHVVLDAEKMAALTETIRQNAGKLLDKAAGQLSSAKKQVTDAQAALDDGIRQAANGIGDSVTDALNKAVDALKSALDFTPNMSEEEKQLRQTIAADQEAMNANNEKIQANLGIIADPDATEEEKADPRVADPVLKEGALLTNVFNRLARSCFYEAQKNFDGCMPLGKPSPEAVEKVHDTMRTYDFTMHRAELHSIMSQMDEFIRWANKRWADGIREATNADDDAMRRQVLLDSFYLLRVACLLMHPVVPKGCEMICDYMDFDPEDLFSWNYDFEGMDELCSAGDITAGTHPVRELPPRFDFFKKHESQY